MKLRKTLAGILGAVVMLLGVGTFEHINGHFNDYKEVYAANDPVTVTMTSFSATSGSLNDIVSYTTAKGNGTSEPAANSGEIRLYQNANGKNGGYITVTVPSPYELKSVTIGSSMATTIAHVIDGDKTSLSANGKYTVEDINDTTISFYCYGKDKNSRLYVNYLSVTYISTASSDCEHKNTSETINNATCLTSGTKVVTCDDCKIIISNEEIAATGHNFENGVCSGCKLDAATGVKTLFTKYYNNNQYLKETVLYTTDIADEEVKTYFHASASVKERETWYFGDNDNGTTSLTMYTNEDTNEDGIEENVVSTYENKDGKVYHTGKGGDWYVNNAANGLNHVPTSVEDMFVTLKDFINSEDKNWICNDNETLFTYNLIPATETSEHEMTRFAREFVAPMWLAPNANNCNYIRFTKLTVEDKSGVGLVMKLYVQADNIEGMVTNSDGLFAQATINKVYNLTINTDDNCSVEKDNCYIAANHSVNYSVNVVEGYDLVISSVSGVTATLAGANGISVSNPTKNAVIELATKVATNEKESTISFATKDQRTEQNSSKQVWSDGNVVLTNNKASSTSPVGDYASPARFYANSNIIIERTGMTKIVFNCSSTTYATDLGNSIGQSAKVNGKVVTVEFAEAVDSYTITLSKQVRMDSMIVTYKV